MSNESILVVEDEKLLRWSVVQRLTQEGYRVSEAPTGAAANDILGGGDVDLVLMDYRLPDTDGSQILRDVLGKDPNLLVIVMTAYSTVQSAVEAIKAGAYDYLTKPFDLDELVFIISKALETTGLRREVAELRAKLGEQYGVRDIIGKSPKMLDVFATIEKVAKSEATTVLLQGESGTGKGLAARAIHSQSRRANKPFLTVTCTALPENLLETELFGHEKGAFTDAKSERRGQFELADGGTIFLDEIGDLSQPLQAKLLRFIEEKTLRRVGGDMDIRVDVRIIAATNQILEKAVEEGRFRPDLYYRLKIVPITLPPLRQRIEDVPLLVQAFIDQFNREFNKRVKGLTDEAMNQMMRYHWPGNVRELRNMIERATLLASKEMLDTDVLFPDRPREKAVESPTGEGAIHLPPSGIELDKVEAELVRQALDQADGNQSAAARLLGITRDQIRSRIKKFGLGSSGSKGRKE
ncbi:MAG: sigma-54-dependent Fis family transcriptional regulator [Planctomycetes bacterium]|nr:sigma-54-dependent Fis family transcriptional regulator [Planctomycetota bacterium]